MAIKPRQIVATDSQPQEITQPDTDMSIGQTVAFVSSAPAHYGHGTVANTGADRGALWPAGFYSFDLPPNNRLFVIAPSSQTVTLENLNVSV